MKKTGYDYIDDFLIEKFINQWISEKHYLTYMWVFRVLFECKLVIPWDLHTYTTLNFKRFLWDNFIKRNWSSATYNKYRKCLKAYCKYLVDEWYLQENPIDKISKRKEPKQLPKTLTREQVKELTLSLENTFDKGTFTWMRNITLVYTYLYTGMRLSELTNIKLENLDLIDSSFSVLKWKWSKDRKIPISNTLLKILYSYLKERKKYFTDDLYLFPTIKGNLLQQRDMRSIIEKIRKWITFYFTWHQLRHTFATELVRNNFDVYNISQILWHSKIDTTKIYLSVDTHKLKKQIDKVSLFA